MGKNKKHPQLKLISSLTSLKGKSQEGEEIALLIKRINETGRKNKATKTNPEPEPPLAA